MPKLVWPIAHYKVAKAVKDFCKEHGTPVEIVKDGEDRVVVKGDHIVVFRDVVEGALGKKFNFNAAEDRAEWYGLFLDYDGFMMKQDQVVVITKKRMTTTTIRLSVPSWELYRRYARQLDVSHDVLARESLLYYIELLRRGPGG